MIKMLIGSLIYAISIIILEDDFSKQIAISAILINTIYLNGIINEK